MLDPQVQARLIDLAAEWAKQTLTPLPGKRTRETRIDARAKGFEYAYRTLLKIVQDGESSTTRLNV